jgi:hypothetical protein
MRWPQRTQKIAWAGLLDPQAAHVVAERSSGRRWTVGPVVALLRVTPHSIQKRASSGSSASHEGHFIGVLAPDFRVRRGAERLALSAKTLSILDSE